MMESYRSFQTIFDQEERLLNQLERRMQGLEPISNDKDQLRRMTKTVTVRTAIIAVTFLSTLDFRIFSTISLLDPNRSNT